MPDPENHELVIIRRNIDGGDEEHHSGVWKIAFADFMTAMMAFFLVMWLISANEKTRATIARYFNPIKFEETTPNPKGLRDPKNIETKASPKGKDFAGHSRRTPAAEKKQVERKRSADAKPPPTAPRPAVAVSAVRNRPAKKAPQARAQIGREGVARPGVSSPPAERTTASAAKVETKPHEAFRDPFAPSSRVVTAPPTSSARKKPAPSPPKPRRLGATRAQRRSNISKKSSKIAAIAKTKPLAGQTTQAPRQSPLQAAQAQANKLHAAIVKALKADLTSQAGPGIEVRVTKEGTLISLMDKTGFEMFAVGSVKPQPQAVAMMQKVGGILKTYAGSIVIRGYTDGRAYKSTTYDNWRLSADRADVAREMLVSGGLNGKRVRKIEGFADRQLKKPDDPYAAENRRIEILLKDNKR